MQEAEGKCAQVCGNGCQSIKHESINQKHLVKLLLLFFTNPSASNA